MAFAQETIKNTTIQAQNLKQITNNTTNRNKITVTRLSRTGIRQIYKIYCRFIK